MADQTKTGERVLAFIREYIRRTGYAPSIREIGAGVGLTSSSSVAYQLEQLENAGHIRRNPAVSRSIVLLDGADRG